MTNPWLQVPLGDYEGHMTSPAVKQLAALAELFAIALGRCAPTSMAILGIAGGNGLEHINGTVIRRVVGIDINPDYLEAVRQRYAHLLGLELHCADLASDRLTIEPLALVHAALVFEHAGVGLSLENALNLVAQGGAFSVVLQLPGNEPAVGDSGFQTIQTLSADFVMIDPTWFRLELESRGFRLTFEMRKSLVSGKAFWMGIFARELPVSC